MNPELWTFETWQIIAGAALLALVVAGIIWLMVRRSHRKHHGHHLTEQQRYDALTREHAGITEKHTLLADRVERLDRTQHELREELAALRADLSRRLDSEAPQRTYRELQDQIFELREEVKVLLQRDDRHERSMQELQSDMNQLRRDLSVSA